jgi:hypothetical protein
MHVNVQIMLKFTFYKYQNWQYFVYDKWQFIHWLSIVKKLKYSSWIAVQYYNFITIDDQYIIRHFSYTIYISNLNTYRMQILT